MRQDSLITLIKYLLINLSPDEEIIEELQLYVVDMVFDWMYLASTV